MAPYNVNKVLADTERVLKYANPAFDITDTERQMAREQAEIMCALLAQCKGNRKEFVKAMVGVVGTAQVFLQWAREHAGSDSGEFADQTETDWHKEEKEKAIEDFDNQFGGAWRKEQIQQAVNVACYMVLEEEGTVFGKIRAWRRKMGALLPWNEKGNDPRTNSICARVPEGMDIESALELASGRNFCDGGMCNDVRRGIVTLFLTADAESDNVRMQLAEMGFAVVEKEQKSFLGRIRTLFDRE